jgi:hypothetical protein
MLWAPASLVVRHRLLSTTVVTSFSSGLVASPCHQQSLQHVALRAIQKEIGSGTNPSRCHCTATRMPTSIPPLRHMPVQQRQVVPPSIVGRVASGIHSLILAGSSKQPSMAGPQDRVVRFATAAIGPMDGRRLLWHGSKLACSPFLEL